jgi:mono/diheme cytochrome c family protein
MKLSRTGLVILTIILTVLVSAAIVVIAGLVVIYTGTPNVAATSPHTPIVRWILSTTMDHAVESAARGVKVPPDYNQIDIRAGYYHYDSMCIMCHGAPGQDRQWVGKGLYPEPPYLYRSVVDLSPAEVFWIAKHGIKDTGMPALQPTRTDGEIWKIAAFVKRLPEITPEEYQTLGQGSGGTPAATGTSPDAGGRLPPGENQAGAGNQ